MKKLSVVLATKNEEKNIGRCLESVKTIADEIIVYDEYSTDKTCEIAKQYKAKIYKYNHKDNFHETKQMAIEKAEGEWVLQLDADEEVTEGLSKEIVDILSIDAKNLSKRKLYDKHKSKLFLKHQKLSNVNYFDNGENNSEVVAFFIPRVNMFLGKPLIHAGVYPDGVIRLFKKGKAKLLAKNVHELMQVAGKVDWLYNNLNHFDSPTLERYFERSNRYTSQLAKEFKNSNISLGVKTMFYYSFIKPFLNFLLLFVIHKGFLDGMRGFIWSLFSSLRFTIAYFKYWQESHHQI